MKPRLFDTMKPWLAATLAVMLVATSLLVQAAEQKKVKEPAGKRERIDCMVGTEDRQARIAIEARGGRIMNFAFYGKTKPRTCSMDVRRGDAYSSWKDTGNATVVTLVDETGDFLIDRDNNQYRFIFRNIDRMRYCGMEGKINGSLTVSRGKKACSVDSNFLEATPE